MNKTNFGYLLREGARGMFVHGFRSFATVCVIVACLIIMGSFCLISFNLRVMVNELQHDNKVLVYIDDTYTEAEAKSVGSQINMIANVSDAVFVSRQQALDNYVASQDNPDLFAGLNAETMRDRFEVSLVDYSLMKQTVAEIEAVPGVGGIGAEYEITEGFQTVQNVLNVASFGIIIVLFVVSLFIISNTVKLSLYDRKEEIAIMRMVGATNGFIRFPFVVEGFFLGVLGSAIAFFAEWGLYDFLRNQIVSMDTLQMFTIVPFSSVLNILLIAYLIVGFVVGVFGSMLSIRRFMQV